MLALIVAGYVAALALGVANLALAVLTTALGIAYSKTFKGHAILGNFDRGVLGVCAVVFGALAGGGRFSLGLALLASVAFFHDRRRIWSARFATSRATAPPDAARRRWCTG